MLLRLQAAAPAPVTGRPSLGIACLCEAWPVVVEHVVGTSLVRSWKKHASLDRSRIDLDRIEPQTHRRDWWLVDRSIARINNAVIPPSAHGGGSGICVKAGDTDRRHRCLKCGLSSVVVESVRWPFRGGKMLLSTRLVAAWWDERCATLHPKIFHSPASHGSFSALLDRGSVATGLTKSLVRSREACAPTTTIGVRDCE